MERLAQGEILPFGPEFKMWRDRTTKIIFRYFPENGREAQEWAKVFFPRRVYSGREDPVRSEDCRAVLAEAVKFLDETCRKLKESMSGETILLGEDAAGSLAPEVEAMLLESPSAPALDPLARGTAIASRSAAGTVLDEVINEVSVGMIPLEARVKEGALQQLVLLRDELDKPYPNWEIVRPTLLWLSGIKAVFLRVLPEIVSRSQRMAG